MTFTHGCEQHKPKKNGCSWNCIQMFPYEMYQDFPQHSGMYVVAWTQCNGPKHEHHLHHPFTFRRISEFRIECADAAKCLFLCWIYRIMLWTWRTILIQRITMQPADSKNTLSFLPIECVHFDQLNNLAFFPSRKVSITWNIGKKRTHTQCLYCTTFYILHYKRTFCSMKTVARIIQNTHVVTILIQWITTQTADLKTTLSVLPIECVHFD